MKVYRLQIVGRSRLEKRDGESLLHALDLSLPDPALPHA